MVIDGYLLILSIMTSFFTVFLITPVSIRFAKAIGVIGRDAHKKGNLEVAEFGGLCVVPGFLAGIFMYITIKTFLYSNTTGLIDILAVISTTLIITIIGMLDTLTSLMKRREGNNKLEKFKRVGIRQIISFLLPFPAAIPLVAVKAGVMTMGVPFIGDINFGLLYPLFFIPIAIVGASNATNMLAGLNGLEAGMGFVALASLGIFALLRGNIVASSLALTFGFALLAFLKYNKYPSRVFPGDLTYIIGAVIASVAIVGNMEKFALFIFTPWFLEFFLKLRSRFKAESFGILQEDGTLKAPYKKVYSLTHLVMKTGRFKEWEISLILVLAEVIISVLAFFIVLNTP